MWAHKLIKNIDRAMQRFVVVNSHPNAAYARGEFMSLQGSW